MHQIVHKASILLSFIKWKIALAVTFTTFAGYLLLDVFSANSFMYALIGVFFLAAASLSLNQLQEKNYDDKMQRTANRPLPKQQLSIITGFVISMLLLLAGAWLLYYGTSLTCLLLGLFNVLWYNVVYTYLKRITPFAVVAGALIGAVPALIGWSAAGGQITDYRIIFVASFLFIWQIPHFWLILYKYDDEYRQAGFPGLFDAFNKETIHYVLFVWLLTTSLFSIFFAVFGIVHSVWIAAFLLLLNAWLIFFFYRLLFYRNIELHFTSALSAINIYMLANMLLLIVNAVV